MVEDKWKNAKIEVGLGQLTAEDLNELLAERIARAEKSMLDNFHADLFGGSIDVNDKWIPPTFWERVQMWPYRIMAFVRWRIIGIWNVLRFGECKNCEHNDYD